MAENPDGPTFKPWRTVFWLAAAFNLAIGAAMVVASPLFYRLAGAVHPASRLEPQLIGGFIVTFGIGYGFIARAPQRNRDLMRMGVIGKTGAAIVIWWRFFDATAPLVFAVLVSGDLIWAAVFVLFLRQSRERDGAGRA